MPVLIVVLDKSYPERLYIMCLSLGCFLWYRVRAVQSDAPLGRDVDTLFETTDKKGTTMHAFLESPATWVALSFFLFLWLVHKPVGRWLAGALDARSARIARELDEAMRLKKEAESLLAEYQQRRRECIKEAEAILRQTRADAARMREEAEAALVLALKRRSDAALEHIAQAEGTARREVRQHLVDLAVGAARTIVAQHLGTSAANDLIRCAISDAGRTIH